MTEEIRCPVCGTPSGKISDRDYFCPECALEFNPKNGRQYALTKSGGRVRVAGEGRKHKAPVKRSEAEIAEKGYLQGLNYWRLKNGYSWATVAEFVGLSAPTLIKYSNCETLPDQKTVVALCTVLGVSAEALRQSYSREEMAALQEVIFSRGVSVMTDKARKNPRNSRRVYCRETGKVYSSLSSAATELNIPLSGICKVCRGDQLAVEGYHFNYM